MSSTAPPPMNAAAAVSSTARDRPAVSAIRGRAAASEMESPFRETRLGWAVLGVVWAICAVYMASCLTRGWIPHDAGLLAESAQRVLRGQVPYRDFGEVHTGGLSYLDALAFRLFGANFLSLRIPVFLFFLGWVPSVYFIARRFCGPMLAAIVTLLSVLWSVPNYPEAMPSTYNLFFTTWGTLALLRYVGTERRRWLWIAGACGGLSFLAKIFGLYFVAAGLLFLIYREQQLAQKDHAAAASSGGTAYRVFVACGLGLFVLALVDLVSERPTLGEYFQFLLPSVALVAFLLWEEWRQPAAGDWPRFRRLFSMGLPFVAGTVLPVIPFLLWFAHVGALRDWYEGTFVRSLLHTHWTGYDAIPLAGLLALLPVLVVIIAAYDSHSSIRRLARWGAPLLLGALLAAGWKWFGFYVLLGCSPVFFVVLAALAAPVCLRRAGQVPSIKRQSVFLVVAVMAVVTLVQFPLSILLYFCYVAPLVALALLSLWSLERSGEKTSLAVVVGFYFAFALLLHAPGFYVAVGTPPLQPLDLRPIALARAGGLRAPAPIAAEFEQLVRVVRAHAKESAYIYATPDCAEVYFLSGYRNPTSTIYDFLDSDYFYPTIRNQRILDTLTNHHVRVVVFGPPDQTDSGVVPPSLKATLDAAYPDSRKVGDFDVRWKP